MNRSAVFCGIISTWLCLAIGAGCKPDEPKKPKSRVKEGVITRIETDKNRIAMKMHDPRNPGQFLSMELEGTVTPTTEIWLNGKTAKLADLRVKDDVKATGYMQGKGETGQIVAEKLSVQRPVEIMLPPAKPAQPTPPPATQASTAVQPIKQTEPARQTPTAAPTAAPIGAKTPMTGPQLARAILDEVKRQRAMHVATKAQLIKDGHAADDPQVLNEDAIIAKADQTLAQVETELANKGINPYDDSASSKPASAPKTP